MYHNMDDRRLVERNLASLLTIDAIGSAVEGIAPGDWKTRLVSYVNTL